VWLNWKAHAGAVAEECGEVKTHWFRLNWILRAESRNGCEEVQHRHENKHLNYFVSQVSAPPNRTLMKAKEADRGRRPVALVLDSLPYRE
jgi:hypothetical protein